MSKKKRYEVLFDYDCGDVNRSSVIIRELATYACNIKVKCRDLSPEYANKAQLKVKDTGEGLVVKAGAGELKLDYAEEEYLLAALLVNMKKRNCKVDIYEQQAKA